MTNKRVLILVLFASLLIALNSFPCGYYEIMPDGTETLYICDDTFNLADYIKNIIWQYIGWFYGL